MLRIKIVIAQKIIVNSAAFTADLFLNVLVLDLISAITYDDYIPENPYSLQASLGQEISANFYFVSHLPIIIKIC